MIGLLSKAEGGEGNGGAEYVEDILGGITGAEVYGEVYK